MTNQNDYNHQVIEEFRTKRSQGQREERPRLLLTTRGAKSGKQHTTPMMYISDVDRLLVVASNIGAPRHPDWYYNLVASPGVTVEVGNETFSALASVTQGEERERLWTRIVEVAPFFLEHQAKTARQIPIIVLSRQAS
jgi:deazaflavin-dependent oxidoreductase (nitroreductase family)